MDPRFKMQFVVGRGLGETGERFRESADVPIAFRRPPPPSQRLFCGLGRRRLNSD